MNKHRTIGLSAVLALASLASAQQLTVPLSIGGGQDITIGYSNPAKAGQTVVVTVAAAFPELEVVELLIHLDQKGRGEVEWSVPDALAVLFNAPGCRQVTRLL